MTHGRAAATGAHTPTRPDQPADAVTARQATDPDVDLHVPQQRQELRRHPAVLLATIAAGGALGALGRYGLSVALPHPAAGFPWSTFVANVPGAFLIGALMVLITEVLPAHPLLRPFLAVGVLGGYTTFSTSIVDTQRLVGAGAARTALLYLVGTLASATAGRLNARLGRRGTLYLGIGTASAGLLVRRRRAPAAVPATVRTGCRTAR